MLGLTLPEIGIITWIVVAIVSARFWPRMGEWVMRKLVGGDDTER